MDGDGAAGKAQAVHRAGNVRRFDDRSVSHDAKSTSRRPSMALTLVDAGDREGAPMTERKRHDDVSVDIAAPPERVYELVADITRMGEWSPECYQCSWAKGATGPAVGARFKAKNKGGRGPSWFNTPTVTAADPGREFAFNRSGPGIGSYTWRYTLEPIPTGTKLTESFDAERPLGAPAPTATRTSTRGCSRRFPASRPPPSPPERRRSARFWAC
jgi:uncharacterized protein YndB with AHSA1/START domain